MADVEPCVPHGLDSYTDDAGTVHVSTGARCIAPDPERDKRIDLYRDRERRRAARALDRYFDVMHNGVEGDPAAAGERFVEQVGDYVLARLGHDPSVTQHKSHYDVPRNVHCSNCGDTRGGPIGHETSECTWDSRSAHNAGYGATPPDVMIHPVTGDVRCPNDGEFVNKRCWKCHWVRPAEQHSPDSVAPDEGTA